MADLNDAVCAMASGAFVYDKKYKWFGYTMRDLGEGLRIYRIALSTGEMCKSRLEDLDDIEEFVIVRKIVFSEISPGTFALMKKGYPLTCTVGEEVESYVAAGPDAVSHTSSSGEVTLLSWSGTTVSFNQLIEGKWEIHALTPAPELKE